MLPCVIVSYYARDGRHVLIRDVKKLEEGPVLRDGLQPGRRGRRRQELPCPHGRVGVHNEVGGVQPPGVVIGQQQARVAEDVGRGEVEAAVVQPPGEGEDDGRGRPGVQPGLQHQRVLGGVLKEVSRQAGRGYHIIPAQHSTAQR